MVKMWDKYDIYKEINSVEENISNLNDDNYEILAVLNDYKNLLVEAIEGIEEIEDLTDKLNNNEELFFDDGTLITYEVLQEEENNILQMINDEKNSIEYKITDLGGGNDFIKLSKEFGGNFLSYVKPFLKKAKQWFFKKNETRINAYVYNYYHSPKFTTLLSSYMLDYSKIVNDYIQVGEETNRFRGYSRKSEDDLSHYNDLIKESKELEVKKNKIEENIRAITSTPTFFKLRGGFKDYKVKLLFGLKTIPIGYHVLFFFLTNFIVRLFFGMSFDVISIGVVSIPLYLVGLTLISGGLFNRRARIMKNKNDLDLYELYEEIDSALYTLTLEDNRIINHLILQVKNPLIRTMQRIASNEMYYDEDLQEYVNKEFDLRRIKLSGFNGTNGGSSYEELDVSSMDDNLDSHFDSEFDDWNSEFDDFEDVEEVDEGDVDNPRFEQWITYFEVKYKKKRTHEEWSELDVRVPEYIQTSDNTEVHLIPQLFTTNTFKSDEALLNRIFNMDILNIYKNYEGKGLAIEFAETMIIKPYSYQDIADDFDDSYLNNNYEVGRTIYNEPLYWRISCSGATSHGSVTGGSGSGKSVIQKNILWQALYRKNLIVTLDFKSKETFGFLEDLNFRVYDQSEMTEVIVLLDELLEEQDWRIKKVFRKHGVANLDEYLELYEEANDEDEIPFIPRIFLIIDELGYLEMVKGEEETEALGKLDLIWAQGRSSGIHVISGLQKGSANSFAKSGRTNQGFNIVGKNIFGAILEFFMGKGFEDSIRALPNGEGEEGHFWASNSGENIYMRSPFEKNTDFVKRLREFGGNIYKDYHLGDKEINSNNIEVVKESEVLDKNDEVESNNKLSKINVRPLNEKEDIEEEYNEIDENELDKDIFSEFIDFDD